MPPAALPPNPFPGTCWLSATALAAVLALSACASRGPVGSELAGLEVPLHWSGDTGHGAPTALADWWQRFNDPLLVMLVAQALQANTTVRAAQAALLQARALRDVGAASLAPTLGSSATAQRSRSNHNTGNSFRVGLDAGWELDVFGANRSGVDASEAGARASAASLGNVQVSIAAELVLAYITLRSTQERLAIASANLAIQQDSLQLTQWRLQAGLVSMLDTEQARTAAAQTQAQLPALQTAIEQTRHAIAVLTGQPPTALARTLDAATPVPRAPAKIALSLPAETLRQRPDVRAAEWQVTAAMARTAQADAQRRPSFKLSGSLGLNALTLGALTNGASVAAALLAGVSLPVFDGGAALAQVRAQQAAQQQAQADYHATVLGALRDVEDALVALQGNRTRLVSLQDAAAAAANAAELARQRYSSGLVDFQTVLETQRTQLGTQDGVASAIAAVSSDHVRLYKALGGGWLSDDTRPDTRASTP